TLERLERQLVLPLMGLVASGVKPAAAGSKLPREGKRRHGGGRGAFPAYIPRVEVKNPVPPDLPICPQCGQEMKTGSHSLCWTNARWVSFFYSAHGDAQSVRDFLGDDLARNVQCDGTSVTNCIERAGGKRPGCMGHGRRRFVEAARGGDLLALEGVRLIAPLFEIERVSKLAGDTAEQRLARRIEHSKPVIDMLRAWLDE